MLSPGPIRSRGLMLPGCQISDKPNPRPICFRGFDSAKIRAGLAGGLRVTILQRSKRPPATYLCFHVLASSRYAPASFTRFSEKSARVGRSHPGQQSRMFKHAMHPGRIPRGRFAFVSNFLPVNGRPLPGLASWASWVPRAGSPVWIRGPWSLVPVKENLWPSRQVHPSRIYCRLRNYPELCAVGLACQMSPDPLDIARAHTGYTAHVWRRLLDKCRII